jgi:hypothetical protein
VKSAFEYEPGKIIALINGSKHVRFIDRSNKKEDTTFTIKKLSQDTYYMSVRPLPNFDYNTFPFIIIKDSQSLNVVNVRTMESRVIVKNSPYNWK